MVKVEKKDDFVSGNNLNPLDFLLWPSKVIQQQKQWISKARGVGGGAINHPSHYAMPLDIFFSSTVERYHFFKSFL